MKTNYVLFIALSFLVLFGWNYATVKRGLLPGMATSAAPASVEASPAGAPTPVSVTEERPIEKTIGRHHVTFNARGAGLLQWRIEDGVQASLVLPDANGENPLAAFPGLSFSETPSAGGAAFQAARPDGLHVRQSYGIDPEGAMHAVTLTLENTGKAPVDASFELGWGPGIEPGVDLSARGAQRSAEERALALEGDHLLVLTPGAAAGAYRWFAVDARYFLAAFLNDGGGALNLTVVKKDHFYSVRRVERISLAPGEKKELVQRFYLGPKGYDGLASLNLGLERAVNFGKFAVLGRWIHRALISLKGLVGNFGWAIIILTFCVQVLLSPLTVTSFKHGQKMKALQPQMKRLQEMHKSDPQRLNKEMLALYQRHGLKFMGMEGCLPMVVQMPVFFALYAVLYKTYELRHAPWIGWITDLSMRDPYYVLPVLMGGAMFAQQKITAVSADPTQKQLMYMMPVMFTFIFLKMPSGLVIYWLTQNLLSLCLQLFLLKRQTALQEKVL